MKTHKYQTLKEVENKGEKGIIEEVILEQIILINRDRRSPF